MKRFLSILLVMMMLTSCLVACSSDDDKEDNSGVGTVEQGESVPYDPAIDSLYYDDLDITLYYAEIGGAPRLEYEITEYTGDTVNDVVFRRNLAVKEKFGVNLLFEHDDGQAMVTDLRKRHMAQDPTCDIIAPYAYYGVALAIEGVYANIMDMKYLNVKNSWWNQSYVDAITYNGQLYSLIGDLTTSATTCAVATFVNTKMMKEFGLGDVDLFETVDSGKWTLEYMMLMCKDVYAEDDTINDRSEGGRYGFILGQISQPAEALLVSHDFDWTVTNDDGTMDFCLNSEKNVDILSDLESFYNSRFTGIYKVPALSGSEFATKGVGRYIELFTQQKTMVTISFLHTAEEIVKTPELEYLILPVPKGNVDQDGYRSMTHDSHCNISISSQSDSQEAAAAILEYMGYYSEKELTPRYFEISYQAKYASDINTMRLFDTIVDNICFDFARTYSRSLEDISQKMRGLVKDSLNISSTIKTYQTQSQRYLDTLVHRFKGLKG
jgi:ABC-type glycerol-3-phosphate transport system substrate-binding protein